MTTSYYSLRNLTTTFIDDLIISNNKLKDAQNELTLANKKLDDQNLILEQEVAKKTASLSQIMLDLEQQKDELIAHQRELRQENENRQYIEAELRKRNQELASSMDTLHQAQEQLVESERMASLGGLVAGIAHDVNTPLGVSVTAASFKQVAVDQTSETEREFVLGDYINEIIQSLKPSFKHTEHQINVSCPDNLVVTCAPGAIAQIVTNMVVNSITHGFEGKAGRLCNTRCKRRW